MHGDDDDNSSFTFSVNYSSALVLPLANISGLLFVFFFWIIGLENIFLNLVSRGKRQVKMAKLGFEKDCNINEDNSNNNYNSCVFVNGIIKVIFVYVVCCITGPTSPTPVLPPCSPVFSLLFSSFSLFF